MKGEAVAGEGRWTGEDEKTDAMIGIVVQEMQG